MEEAARVKSPGEQLIDWIWESMIACALLGWLLLGLFLFLFALHFLLAEIGIFIVPLAAEHFQTVVGCM